MMKAMSVIPGKPDSATVAEVPGPPESDGSILVEGLLVGICGTDGEILRGYGQVPEGSDRLVIGHESLGRVIEAPPDAGVKAGDLVAGVVRRPDPVPCAACAAEQWEFCENGRYTERGIKGRNGYGRQRWRVGPRFALPVPAGLGDHGVLTEPGSVVAKAWEQIEAITARSPVTGRRALVVGAGPIGLLAALLGVQRGYEVHVLDQVTSGPKPGLVAALGATYHHGQIADLDLAQRGRGVHGDRRTGRRARGQGRAGGRDLPGGHLVRAARRPRQPEPGQRRDRAGERRARRYRQRRQAQLHPGCGCAREGRQGMAVRADQPPRAAVVLARRTVQGTR